MAIRPEEALEYHEQGRPGKLAVVPTKPCHTQRDLSLAYTPGVAEPCRAIARNEEDAYRYTARGNLVAVVSNGTATLGLGNLGPLAAKPVMEGKAVLFKRFADIDVFDLEVASEKAEDLIRFCELLEPTVGGINLEDIAAPACFVVEQTLKERLQIPVFHDDQHGTAIISGAALLNALELAGKDIRDVKVVFSGAGAAGVACAHHYIALGVRPENILMCDSKGVLTRERAPKLDEHRRAFAAETDRKTLAEALVGADVFAGLSVGGIVSREMVKRMAPTPIILAMANPDPEILPEDVFAVRDDAIVATGRSDYPNQVNNVLGFPFIFRGALDVRARSINEEMKMAATRALAALAKEPVPEAVARAYGIEYLEFGREYLIPKPFDARVLLWVASAVAEAAMRTGVARREIDPAAYRDQLEARLGRAREVMRRIVHKAARDPKRVVFPEATHERILRAVEVVLDERIAKPVLVGDSQRIAIAAGRAGIDLDWDRIEVADPAEHPKREAYIESYYRARARKGVTRGEAEARLARPIYFAAAMVKAGDADALIAGQEMHYPETLRPCLETVGVDPDAKRIAGLYLMVLEQDLLFFADTTVNIDPDAEILADVAILAAEFVRNLGITPKVAMLSFSNFGSARHPFSQKVADATRIVKGRAPGLVIDGEMQADTAVVPAILRGLYPFSDLQDRANILIFPSLDAANISYKLLARLGHADAIGPVLLGMARPVHVLQRGCDVSEIVNLTAIAVVDAQTRIAGASQQVLPLDR